MKYPRRIYFGLTVLSVAVTTVFLALMPYLAWRIGKFSH